MIKLNTSRQHGGKTKVSYSIRFHLPFGNDQFRRDILSDFDLVT